MTQLGSFPCDRRDALCHLAQPFIQFTSDYNNSRNSWMGGKIQCMHTEKLYIIEMPLSN